MHPINNNFIFCQKNIIQWPHCWYTNGISNNIMQFFKQNDYPRQLRQIVIFKERYKSGIRQSDQYVFSICKKKSNVVYSLVNSGLSIWLVYESHRKVIFSQITVYKAVYEYFGISALHEKKAIYRCIATFCFCCEGNTFFKDHQEKRKKGVQIWWWKKLHLGEIYRGEWYAQGIRIGFIMK